MVVVDMEAIDLAEMVTTDMVVVLVAPDMVVVVKVMVDIAVPLVIDMSVVKVVIDMVALLMIGTVVQIVVDMVGLVVIGIVLILVEKGMMLGKETFVTEIVLLVENEVVLVAEIAVVLVVEIVAVIVVVLAMTAMIDMMLVKDIAMIDMVVVEIGMVVVVVEIGIVMALVTGEEVEVTDSMIATVVGVGVEVLEDRVDLSIKFVSDHQVSFVNASNLNVKPKRAYKRKLAADKPKKLKNQRFQQKK